jgi:hypothetical protein
VKHLAGLSHFLYERCGERGRRWLGLLKSIVLLPRCLWLRRCGIEIAAGSADSPCRAVYIGEGLSLSYYLQLLHPGAPRPDAVGVPFWRLPEAVRAAASEAPVVLVEINRLLEPFLPAGGFTAEPWVRQQTDLRGDRYQRRRRGIERSFGQPVRRHGYHCRFSREPADLEQFYRDYYVPYMARRHGAMASLRSLGELRWVLRSGFLLQVWQGQEWVSALLVSRLSRRCVQLWALGRRSRGEEDLHDGALSATYYFLFGWAREQGLEKVDFLGARPHLGDGVFLHKSLWAAQPQRDPWHHTAIVFYVNSSARLPAAVTGQLVRSESGFVPIGECLNPSR